MLATERHVAAQPIPDRERAEPLGRATLRGFAWLLSHTVLTKAANVARQIALAWWLLPEHFGLVGLALTVTAFVGACAEPGLGTVLVQREREFSRWATPAFWISVSTGVVGALVTVGLAPLAATFYGEPRVGALLLVLAVSIPATTLAIVPRAYLQGRLEFGKLAIVGTTAALAQSLLSILFAVWGFGALSFVLPAPIVETGRCLALWLLARPRVGMRARFSEWPSLMGDTSLLFLGNLFVLLLWQGDYIVLGWFHSSAVVGLYYFGYSLSWQTFGVFTSNLAQVIFPALSRLNAEPARQLRAFLQASRLLAVLAVPACLLQAAVADPLIRVLFDARWHAAIPIIQVLSLGMAARTTGSPAGALLKGQGRFRTLLICQATYGLVFLGVVATGALAGAAMGVAIAAAGFFAVLGPVNMYVAVRPLGGTWRQVLSIFVAPSVAGLAAVAAGLLAARALPSSALRPWFELALFASVSAPLYVLLIRRLAPDAWDALSRHVGALLRARKPAWRAAPTSRRPA